MFCMEINIKERKHVRQMFLVGCGQLHLLLNQIAVFLDHQYVRKESIYLLDFLYRNNHLGKVGCENTLVGHGQLCILFSQIAGFFNINSSGRNFLIKPSLRFFVCRSRKENKENIWDYHFWLGVVICASYLIRFEESLIINVCGRE